MDNTEAINDAVDVLDARKVTPLHTAVKYSGEASVLLLLEYGADPNSVTQKGETPLLRIRSSKMAQLLLSFGADPYVGKDSKGEMKTAYDVFMTKNAAAAQVLMNKGITCNEQDLSSSNLLIIYDLEPFRKHFSPRHGEMSLHQKIVQRQLKA